MAVTTISDLWVPDVWVRGLDELMHTYPSIFTSAAVTRSQILDMIASGEGNTASLPFLEDITDTDEELQNEAGTLTINAVGGSKNVAVMLNRQLSFGSTALAKQIAGADPVKHVLLHILMSRQKRAQKVLLAEAQGLFNDGNASAALADNATVSFVEDVDTDASADNYIDSDLITDAISKLGENSDTLEEGILAVHPVIASALRKQDDNDFHRKSEGDIQLEYWRGLRIVLSNALVRAATTDGNVYRTYIFGKNSIGYGAKPQSADQIDVASLQYEKDKIKNQEIIIDRTRTVLHVNGTAWKGTPAAQSPTNAELGTMANWELAFQTADRVRAVGIFTNG